MFQGSFQSVSRKFQGNVKGVRLKGISRVFERRLMVCLEVSWVFQCHFKGVSRKFQRSVKEVSRAFQKRSKGVSRKIEGCFKGVFSGFPGYLKEVQREFQRSLNVFQGH